MRKQNNKRKERVKHIVACTVLERTVQKDKVRNHAKTHMFGRKTDSPPNVIKDMLRIACECEWCATRVPKCHLLRCELERVYCSSLEDALSGTGRGVELCWSHAR